MIGILLGLSAAVFYVATAATGDWEVAGWSLLLTGVLVGVLGAVVGLVLRVTIGIAAMWAMFGSLVAAVIEFVQGEPGNGSALLGHALVFFGLQHFLVALRSYAQGSAIRRSTTLSKPVWDKARGFFGVIDVTMMDEDGPGVLTIFTDGTSQFVTDKGVRWNFEPRDWASWRREDGSEALNEIPGLCGKAPTLVLTGCRALMSPDVYVQPDDIETWSAWAVERSIAQEAR